MRHLDLVIASFMVNSVLISYLISKLRAGYQDFLPTDYSLGYKDLASVFN